MLTFYIYATPPCIIFFALAWVLEGDLKRKFTAWFKNKYALLFIVLYLIYLIGMLYTNNTDHGWMDMQIKLSIILFPIILSAEGEMDFNKQKWFGVAFISGAVLNGIICMCYATWLYFSYGILHFTYMEFSKFLHPSYYTMYIDMAFVFIYYALTVKKNELTKTIRIFIYCCAIFLLIMVMLLQSKMGQIVTGLLLLQYFLLKKSPFKLVTAIIIVALLVTSFISGHPKQSRFIAIGNIMSGKKVDVQSVESNQARVLVYKAAWEVIKNNPVIGSGTGDAKYALMKQYQKDGMTGAYREQLNTHNQYLQTTVAVGVPGILILLSNLFIPMLITIKRKRFVYLMFLLILSINFLTESMLEQQAGTMFYGLFNSLLMFNFII